MSDGKRVIIVAGNQIHISEIMDAVESIKEEEPLSFEITMRTVPPEILTDAVPKNKNRRRGNKHINHYNK